MWPATRSARTPPSPDRVGLFTGAGLSTAPPASVPSGDEFHHLLRRLCRLRSSPYADGLVSESALDAIRTSRINLLARIENTRPGAGRGALAAMKVAVPNEAQLLAAAHLALLGFQVTTNFDDGVERAYALLAGRADLPSAASEEAHRQLEVWRGWLPGRLPSLTVLSRPGELAAATATRKPALVKLHGSLGLHFDGATLPSPAMTDEPDPGNLGSVRNRVLDRLVTQDLVVVTGFSAADLASREALLARLSPGRFWWVAQEVDAALKRRLTALDPHQPVGGSAVDALRAVVGSGAPSWPADRRPGSDVVVLLRTWASALPPEVASEALAWALMDSGHLDEAVELLQRLVAAGGGQRTRVRLSDALARRRWPGDVPAARAILLRAAVAGRRPLGTDPPGQRAYAAARFLESAATGHDMVPQYVAVPMAAGALAVLAAGWGRADIGADHTGRVRAATATCGAVLAQLERALPRSLTGPKRRRLARAAVALSSGATRRILDGSADPPSGRRRALLQRQLAELGVVDALLQQRSPDADLLPTLRRLSAVFEHVSDVEGRADTAGTEALAWIARGDAPAAATALRRSARLRPDAAGVASVAAGLLQQSRFAESLMRAGSGRPPDQASRHVTSRAGQGRELAAFVQSLPKVELHTHLEGSLLPGTLASLARRNRDIRVPWEAKEVRGWYRFQGQRDFLNANVLVCEQLRRPEDFLRVVTELGAGLARENVRYAEVAVSPDIHVRRGVPPGELFDALERGRELVDSHHGVQIRWAATAGSRRGPTAAMNALETVLAHRTAAVVSFGLAGLESSVARARFGPVFQLAAESGLHRVVHAGETAGTASIWQALDDLGAERIGHGITCLDDQTLVDRLRASAVPLEVCLSSNVCTGVVASLGAHPLPRLLDAGLVVTLNTDDPAMFGVGMGDELLAAAGAFGLDAGVLTDLTRNAVRASFMTSEEAGSILREIDLVA
jgi:aminodeoxyfutalosine deaminase